jgi:Tfp pilus assembly protein PilX
MGTRFLQKNEQGIALIFTLIVLALLLIMALGFALSSMFDQKSALNAANAAAARILAQTQLKEIVSLIENDEVTLDNSEFYSRDSGSPVVTDTNMLKDMLANRLPVTDILDTVDTDKVNWNYIRSGDSDQAIIGRTAFVVVADGIALDALVDGRAAGAPYPKHNEIDNTETRIGKYVSEINVRAPAPDVSNAIADALNWKGDTGDTTVPGFDNGKYTGNWESFDKLFSTLELAVGSAPTAAQKTELKGLSLAIFKDKEAFWADLDGDENIGSNEIYKRFDLTRNWNTADNTADLNFINSKILLTSGTAPNLDMEKWTLADSDSNSGGLPWLACFGYKDDGTGTGNWVPDESLKGNFASVLDRRRQIAANLKDYCDTDLRPTSDVDPANWLTTEPKFTGNERTPYIDKIGFKIVACQGEVHNDPDDNDVWANIEICPAVELVNLYGNDWPDDLTVEVRGSVDIKTVVGGNSETLSHPLDAAITISSASDWTGASGYSDFKVISLGASNFNTQNTVADANRAISIEVTGINITKVVLHKGGAGYDYTGALTQSFSTPSPVFSGSGNGSVINYAWFGFAVHDPRQNLHLADWKPLTPVSDTSDDPSKVFSLAGTSGKPNCQNSSNVSGDDTDLPSVGPDPETVSDPVNLSTAYIRNAPMESPWELGFIHRGARWETINLKTYVAAKAFSIIDIGGKKYLPGGGAYASGDANILDQVKMTAKASSPQKICLKSPKTEIFDALFLKIKCGCGIEDSVSVTSMAGLSPVSGNEFDAAQAAYFGAKVIAKYNLTANPDERRTRASVVDILKLPDAAASPAISAATDAAQEELIGKVVNLTKIGARVNGFTAIIIAQTIKDVGGSGSDISMTKNSVSGTPSTRSNCRIGQFDATINDINDFNNNIYFDEITAEQKIIVKGYRAIDGKAVITSFQYVE